MVPLAGFANNLSALENLTTFFSPTKKMPVLFFGHGNPMNAINENEFVEGFKTVGKTLTKPNAILCISAHWFTKGTKVTAMEMPKTIHDFGGFPQALFDVQYPAKGSPELAKTTKELLLPTEIVLDDEWGLDHGTWSVIKHLYPDADVPVIQLSIDYTKPVAYHFELAKKLSILRERGVLIVGSGNIVHNLRKVDFKRMDEVDYGFDWAIEARAKFNQHILDGDFNPLLNYQNMGSAIQLAVPTPEHYLPLIYSLALKDKKDKVSLFNDKMIAGSLSMTSVLIQPTN
ncbi:4,5-DOPA-extradiol-dioxygenase [Crocinitomix catalasitica]|uniref:4,5-DOPA-extradiol-dioxygenase n=1 Tax=Crocinitomix catalasitica TaxID=184607 RepID=UPI000488FD18|nr:4,5-DOPA dioxygenase extradiol [Crocinitomix catalasitica]